MTQSLQLAEQLTKTRIKTAKKRGSRNLSVGSVFRELRANDAFSYFGDYPLFAMVVTEIKEAGFPIRREGLFKVMNQIDELSELRQKVKSELVEQLLKADGEHSSNSISRGNEK